MIKSYIFRKKIISANTIEWPSAHVKSTLIRVRDNVTCDTKTNIFSRHHFFPYNCLFVKLFFRILYVCLLFSCRLTFADFCAWECVLTCGCGCDKKNKNFGRRRHVEFISSIIFTSVTVFLFTSTASIGLQYFTDNAKRKHNLWNHNHESHCVWFMNGVATIDAGRHFAY